MKQDDDLPDLDELRRAWDSGELDEPMPARAEREMKRRFKELLEDIRAGRIQKKAPDDNEGGGTTGLNAFNPP